MTTLVIAVLALPCVYWTEGIDTRSALEAAGIEHVCVAPDQADRWREAGFTATPVSGADLAAREVLPVPGVTPRPGIASPTRAPWIVANGWRILRAPGRKYRYEVPAGKGAIAVAEAFAYRTDAIVKLDRADLASAGAMLTFLERLPDADLPGLADFAIVDDGSATTGEVLNLLARRNLLFQVAKSPSPQQPLTIVIGSADYPAAEAADPSAFALKVRRQLGDEQRRLRIFGSEVVIGRLTGDASRVRLHLINYGGREIDGLRIRLRGNYANGEAHVPGAQTLGLKDLVVAEGATEFSLPKMATYAVVDLAVRR